MIKPFHAFLVTIGLVVGYLVLGEELKTKTIDSDEELYFALREPLIATFLYEGQTLTTNEKGQFLVEYSFDGWMPGTPYKIVVGKNIDFHDCAGCIGDPTKGMLSPPEYGDDFVSLQEFIIQMVRANNENAQSIHATRWHSESGYLWEVIPKKNHTLISAQFVGSPVKFAYVER